MQGAEPKGGAVSGRRTARRRETNETRRGASECMCVRARRCTKCECAVAGSRRVRASTDPKAARRKRTGGAGANMPQLGEPGAEGGRSAAGATAPPDRAHAHGGAAGGPSAAGAGGPGRGGRAGPGARGAAAAARGRASCPLGGERRWRQGAARGRRGEGGPRGFMIHCKF